VLSNPEDASVMFFSETVELEPLHDDGVVVEVSGEITHWSEGMQARVTPGMVIRPGCSISMKAGSQLVIRTPVGAIHRLETETEEARNIGFVPGKRETLVDNYLQDADESLAVGLFGLEAAARRSRTQPEESWLRILVRSIPADEVRRLFDPVAATVLLPATRRKYMALPLKPEREGIIPVVSDLWTAEKLLVIAREIRKRITPLACDATTIAALLQTDSV